MAGEFNSIIENQLLNLHTAYLAKVLGVSGSTAKIQPLNLIKAAGKTAKKQAVMSVPISANVKKFGTSTITIDGHSYTIPTVSGISSGDTVICICSERDITETRKGNYAIPVEGHHRISDSIIIGVL